MPEPLWLIDGQIPKPEPLTLRPAATCKVACEV